MGAEYSVVRFEQGKRRSISALGRVAVRFGRSKNLGRGLSELQAEGAENASLQVTALLAVP